MRCCVSSITPSISAIGTLMKTVDTSISNSSKDVIRSGVSRRVAFDVIMSLCAGYLKCKRGHNCTNQSSNDLLRVRLPVIFPIGKASNRSRLPIRSQHLFRLFPAGYPDHGKPFVKPGNPTGTGHLICKRFLRYYNISLSRQDVLSHQYSPVQSESQNDSMIAATIACPSILCYAFWQHIRQRLL